MIEGLNVLVVDDSASVRSSLKKIYEDLGHNIVGECENGLEALELVRQLNPDLLSLDIMMPEMDGIECYRILKEQGHRVKILLVTSLANEPKILEAFEGEISRDLFVSKPVDAEILASKIELVFSPVHLKAPDDKKEPVEEEG